MNCPKCHAVLPSGATVCPVCNTPVTETASDFREQNTQKQDPIQPDSVGNPQNTAAGISPQYGDFGNIPPQYDNTGYMSPQYGAPGYIPPQYENPGYIPPQYDNAGYMPPQYDSYGSIPPQYGVPGNMPPQYGTSGYIPPQYENPGYASQTAQPAKKSTNTTLIIILVILGGLIVIAGMLLILLVSGVFRQSDKSEDATSVVVGDAAEGAGTVNVAGADGSGADAAAADTTAGLDYNGLVSLTQGLREAVLRFVSADVSDYPNVTLYYQVEDSTGNTVTLTSPTAGITEAIGGGSEIERTILSVEKLEGNQGLSIEIVADQSGSMDDSLYEMQSIMYDFVRSLDYAAGDQAEFIAFDNYIMHMCTFTDNVSLLENGISNMAADGGTALYDALYEGLNSVSLRSGARCVIGFTDGADNDSSHSWQEVVNLAQQKEIPIYLIGTYDAESSTLTEIAQQTGGSYHSIGSISDMSDIIDEIYSLQRDMYCVTYVSDSAADPYAERDVSVVLADETTGGTSADDFTAYETLTQTTHASRYEAVQAPVSWSEAYTLAAQTGGHLITITSAEEEAQAISIAESAGLEYVWIGGYTSDNGTVYGHWITGEDFSYSDWMSGEPSHTDEDGSYENCIMLWKINGVWSWNDQRDSDLNGIYGDSMHAKMGYIIEYEQ